MTLVDTPCFYLFVWALIDVFVIIKVFSKLNIGHGLLTKTKGGNFNREWVNKEWVFVYWSCKLFHCLYNVGCFEFSQSKLAGKAAFCTHSVWAVKIKVDNFNKEWAFVNWSYNYV